jgi:hypothetical protein
MYAVYSYHVHLLLAERVYPTTYKILTRILGDDPDFPIRLVSVLWRWMKKLGFAYKKTSKVIVPLDSLFYMAARARYFAKISELRNNSTLIFWHDETWCNQNEEKTFIWTDRDTGTGRLRQNSGKDMISFFKMACDCFSVQGNGSLFLR